MLSSCSNDSKKLLITKHDRYLNTWRQLNQFHSRTHFRSVISKMVHVLTERDCTSILRKMYPEYSSTIRSGRMQAHPFLTKTTGFLADHCLLKIPVLWERDAKKDENIPNLATFFLKILPQNNQQRQYVAELSAFEKEHRCFDLLIPNLHRISTAQGVAWAPDCFLATDNVIVLENLSDLSFIPKKGLLDYEHLKVTIRTLAYFHSSSVIYESNMKKEDPEFCIGKNHFGCTVENVYVEEPASIRYRWFDHCVDIINNIARCLNVYSDKEMQVIEKFTKQMHKDIIETFKPVVNGRNVLQHGDLWPSNVMFKYDGAGNPEECRLVDYQLTRYAAPVLELACVLYNCATRHCRDKYLSELQRVYLENFNSQLKIAGITDLMSEEEVVNEFRRYRMAACLEGFLYGMTTSLDDSISDEMFSSEAGAQEWFYGDRLPKIMKCFKESEPYRSRMTELVRELVEDFILVS